MASLDSLTDSEIRERLAKFGSNVVPVTATTRTVLLKRLKRLTEQKYPGSIANLSYDPRCSITQFSSGEESDEGSGKNRRKSMPPPKTTKSPKRRSPGRTSNVPLANSTFVDHTLMGAPSLENSLPQVSHGMNKDLRRSKRHSGHLDFNAKSNELGFTVSDASERLTRGVYGYTSLDNLTTGNAAHTQRSSTSNYSSQNSADGLRSRFQSNPENNFTPTSSNSPYKPTQPFSSEFAKRLSSSRTAATSPVTSKLLSDVKESDDEDNGSIPVYTKFNQSGVKGPASIQFRSNGRAFSQDGWFSFDSSVSALLVVILLLFFVVLGATYINMHSLETTEASITDIKYPLCTLTNYPDPGVNCIEEENVKIVTKVFRVVHKELFERLENDMCSGNALKPIDDKGIISLLEEKDKTMSVWDFEKSMGSLKILVRANPEWKIGLTPGGIALIDPPSSMICYIYDKLIITANWLTKFLIVAGIFYFFYRGIKWWMWRNTRYNEEVYKLVSSILEIISSKTQETKGCIPISHVRDQLIPLKDRNRLAKLWNDAVTIVESDSRLRCEVQQVEGEEFTVWHWLASPLSTNRRKGWQGQAFDTVEGSVNSLPESPTPCLKIRNMFDLALEEGDDWEVGVKDAILEKCGDAKILHLEVDKHSREGCVYMKCASERDAGIAYRALHGSWFDSNLVTVKYIREKRYLERFPESSRYTQPLFPSNDRKNSL